MAHDNRRSATLLAEMLTNGRISQQEHDELSRAMQQEFERDELTLVGSISLRHARATEGQLHATYKVLNTPELLERILSYLPRTRLLLHGQCVCKGFKRAIESSPMLRRKMFLASKARKNGRFLPYEVSEPYLNYEVERSKNSGEVYLSLEILSDDKNGIERHMKSGLRNMVIAQPAPVEVSIVIGSSCKGHSRDDFKDWMGVCRNEEGIRFGDLMRTFDNVEWGGQRRECHRFKCLGIDYIDVRGKWDVRRWPRTD